MRRYLIVGVSLRSKGGEAMVYEAARRIKELNILNEIYLLVPDPVYNMDYLSRLGNPFNINVISANSSSVQNCSIINKYYLFFKKLSIIIFDDFILLFNYLIANRLGFNLNYISPFMNHLSNSDIIVQIAGIQFTSNFKLMGAIWWTRLMIISWFMGKKYFCLPESIGPSNIAIKILAKIGLSLTTYIMPRGEKSVEFLNSIKIPKTKYSFVPDLAFSYYNPSLKDDLKIYSRYSLDPNDKYVAIFPNIHLYRWEGDSIVDLYSHIVDFIIENLSLKVVLIAHELDTTNPDDRTLNRLIYKKSFKHINDVILISDDLTANEIKSIIKLCTFTVCSRFHAMISSLKMQSPPLVIAWADKYLEIMDLFDMGDFVIDYMSVDKDIIENKLKYLLANYEIMKLKIIKKLNKYENASENMKNILERYDTKQLKY
jgi:colanic acid/amylovoran biosynthesis protein